MNHYIQETLIWEDREELNKFSPIFSRNSLCPILVANQDQGIGLTQERLEYAKIILVNLVKKEKKFLDIAITRWMNSKQPGKNLQDKFIDLRIALEALYLQDSSSEKTFRIAVYGAWHLGNDYNERTKYYGMFKKVYKKASSIIHNDPPRYKNRLNFLEDKDLLKNAQDSCRQSILKKITEEQTQKWNEIILGKNLKTI